MRTLSPPLSSETSMSRERVLLPLKMSSPAYTRIKTPRVLSKNAVDPSLNLLTVKPGPRE